MDRRTIHEEIEDARAEMYGNYAGPEIEAPKKKRPKKIVAPFIGPRLPIYDSPFLTEWCKLNNIKRDRRRTK